MGAADDGRAPAGGPPPRRGRRRRRLADRDLADDARLPRAAAGSKPRRTTVSPEAAARRGAQDLDLELGPPGPRPMTSPDRRAGGMPCSSTSTYCSPVGRRHRPRARRPAVQGRDPARLPRGARPGRRWSCAASISRPRAGARSSARSRSARRRSSSAATRPPGLRAGLADRQPRPRAPHRGRRRPGRRGPRQRERHLRRRAAREGARRWPRARAWPIGPFVLAVTDAGGQRPSPRHARSAPASTRAGSAWTRAGTPSSTTSRSRCPRLASPPSSAPPASGKSTLLSP